MIELQNITVAYGKQQVLTDLTLTLNSGQIIGLVAPNGTGKSTFLHLLLNFIPPQSGKLLINQTLTYGSPKSNRSIHQLITILPALEDLYPDLTGYEHLRLYQRLWQQPSSHLPQIIETLDMSTFLKLPVRRYSYGMRQRLALGMQLATNSPIMLMDEVMNGLDPSLVATVSQLLKDLAQEGKLIVIASHLLDNLEEISQRILFLNDQQVAYDWSKDNSQDSLSISELYNQIYLQKKTQN
ncbi:ABC transporter ATP-binding protein [Vagococcus salmoninarum]|uniref:ABC transporter ATP-binding protein n=1 Tax=Vagococcus salmoninarum TaxID=2739 RepID=UPI0028D2EB13|nr:ABC transporter ATP-binding protein [Vagococcus salmoninarum]